METEVFTSLFNQLPSFVQDQVLKYRKWQDRQRIVIGKNLLITGLQSFNYAYYSLTNLKYTKFQRPYIDSTIDFNISHANDFTVCAISETNRVGIDIEKAQSININDFENQLSIPELKQLSQAKNSHLAFYKLWTQKEAFMKAVGTGLSVPLNKIGIQNNKVTWEGQEWFLHEIKLHKEYICHLCTSTSSPTIVIREIQFPIGKDCH